MNDNNVNFKKQMINDMSEILSNDNISKASKEHILDMYCWILTERIEGDGDKSKNAKFKGCVYWSEEALKQLKKNKKEGKNYESGLRHEHVVPRTLFREYIKNCFDEDWHKKCDGNGNVIEIDKEKINDFFIGCVVTAGEAGEIDKKFKNKFPDEDKITSLANIEKTNLWNRYKAIKILPQLKVSEVKWTFENGRWNEPKIIVEDILNVKESKK